VRAGASSVTEPADRGITVEHPPVRWRLFGRRSNRRITVARPSLTAWLAGPLRAAAAKLALVGKALVVVAFVVGAVYAGRQLVRHVIASPRFAVRAIQIKNFADIVTLQGNARKANIHFGNFVVSENDLAHAAGHVP